MMETCPKCGNKLTKLMLTAYPPLYRTICEKCCLSLDDIQEDIADIDTDADIEIVKKLVRERTITEFENKFWEFAGYGARDMYAAELVTKTANALREGVDIPC